MADIDSISKRNDLEVRVEPHWARVENRLYIGYRKLEQGEGSWIIRLQLDDGKKKYKSLGSITDGKRKAFDEAKRQAIEWADKEKSKIANEIPDDVKTLGDACRAYKPENADIQKRFRRYIYADKIEDVLLEDLTRPRLLRWRKDWLGEQGGKEAERRRKSTINRIWTAVKAALNDAYHHGYVSTDSAWRGIKKLSMDNGESVERARKTRLNSKQITELLKHCDDDLAYLVKAILYTGCRPGEIRDLKARDYKEGRNEGELHITNGKTGERYMTLAPEASAFFKQQAKGKLPGAPLIATAGGGHWRTFMMVRRFKDAARAAGFVVDADPLNNVTLYCLRHTALSRQVETSGLTTVAIAKNCGTSVRMIEQTYFKGDTQVIRDGLSKVKLL